MDCAKLLDVLTSLPVSRSILPRAVYFATSRPANHAICSFIDSSGYASWPIRRCLFIDYIIKTIIIIIIIDSWRASTAIQCAGYIERCIKFSSERKVHSFKPTTPQIIDFLSCLFDSGLKYSAIGTAGSALSMIINICANMSVNIGSDPIVKRYMKGIFNKRPALPTHLSGTLIYMI